MGRIRHIRLFVICLIMIFAPVIQGCMSDLPEDTAPGEALDERSQDAVTPAPQEISVTKGNLPVTKENLPAADEETGKLPKIIVDINDNNYMWEELDGPKYVDTSGSATFVLDKSGDLYYFGQESPTPVVIMSNVSKFSINDNSDTLGYTAPFAVILTKDGDLYACGDTDLGVISDVNVLDNLPAEGTIPFTDPVLISRNVTDCHASWREIDYMTGDNELYRSKHVYDMLENEIDNPTPAGEVEDVADLFIESENKNYVLEGTVQMGSSRSFFISVLEDGSVWTCFLPEDEEYKNYAVGYGEVMGDGSDTLTEGKPVMIFPAGTCF